METITLKYNPSNAFAQALIELIRKTKAVKIVNDSAAEYVPNKETLAAMEDIRQGRVYHAESVDDLFKQILG